MAHLVMIESWILSSGMLLPAAIRNGGNRYTFVCSNPARYNTSIIASGPHPVIAHATKILQVNTNDIAATIAALESLNTEDPFDGVITCCDYYLSSAARIAEHFGLPGPSEACVLVANRKHLMREALKRAGMPGPEFAVAQDWQQVLNEAEKIGFPLVVKPVDLCASQLVTLVSDETALRQSFEAIHALTHNIRGQERLPLILLESFLDGPEFSVETITFNGKTTVIGITDKSLTGQPFFVESGHMFPAEIAKESEHAIGRCAVEALAAVGYDTGVAHVEIKHTSAGPRVVEINTRVGGNWIVELVRAVTGINLLNGMIACSLNEPWHAEQKNTGISSAAIAFLTASSDGQIESVDGWEELNSHPSVMEHRLRPNLQGTRVRQPRDNDDYLGYVICTNSKDENARHIAEKILARVHVHVATAPANQETQSAI